MQDLWKLQNDATDPTAPPARISLHIPSINHHDYSTICPYGAVRPMIFTTYDIHYVMTGFDTDLEGEVGLQAFQLAQFRCVKPVTTSSEIGDCDYPLNRPLNC